MKLRHEPFFQVDFCRVQSGLGISEQITQGLDKRFEFRTVGLVVVDAGRDVVNSLG